MKDKYRCEIVQGEPREYPEMSLIGGRSGNKKIAIDIKTTRRVSKNRIRCGGHYPAKMENCLKVYWNRNNLCHWLY